MIHQNTIFNTIRASGVGIHTGRTIKMAFKPAPADTGIVFRRVDVSPVVDIPAKAEFVDNTLLSTKIAKDGVSVGTTEHLMSAFSGLGIDNCIVELDGPEVPIMDGSAWSYVFLIQSAGIRRQDQQRSFIRILKPIRVQECDKEAELLPYEGSRFEFQIDFDHPVINNYASRASVELNPTTFVREVARARTFGFRQDLEKMRSMNLALGGSMSNAILVDDDGIANEGGLRSSDEFVKHKLLDAIGDLYMAGHIIGEYRGFRSGHALNHKLVMAMLEQKDSWELVGAQSNEPERMLAMA
mgnify:CR=1 FL=1